MHRVLYSCERHESTEGYHVCRLCHSEWRGRYYRDLRIKSIAHQPHPRTRVMGLPRNRMAPVGVLPERSPSYVDSAQRAWTTSPTRDSSETGLKRDTFSTPVAHAFPLSPLCEGHALLTHLLVVLLSVEVSVMAMIPCVECPATISETAVTCPPCGSDCTHGIGIKAVHTAAPLLGVQLGLFILCPFLTRGCH